MLPIVDKPAIQYVVEEAVLAGLTDVLVLTQYNPRSLNDHIGRGRPWDLDRTIGGVRLLQPQVGRGNTANWYRGTADAVLVADGRRASSTALRTGCVTGASWSPSSTTVMPTPCGG